MSEFAKRVHPYTKQEQEFGEWFAQTRYWGQQLLQSHPHVRSRKNQLTEYLNSNNCQVAEK